MQQLDVAPTFVLIAFALPFGALCLAAALAFGLGGRTTAGEIIQQQYDRNSGPLQQTPLAQASRGARAEQQRAHAAGPEETAPRHGDLEQQPDERAPQPGA